MTAQGALSGKEQAINNDDQIVHELVQTGIRLVLERPTRLLDGGLRSEDVINLADSSHATFYRKFTTKSRYLEAVLDRLVNSAAPPQFDIRVHARAALEAVGGHRRMALHALVRTHFDEIFGSTAGLHRLLSTVLGTDGSRTALPVRDAYRRGDNLILQVFEVFFAEGGATLRKPITTRDFSITLTALLDGFLLRHRAEPDSVTPDLVTNALLAVLSVAVDKAHRHSHIDDVTAIEGPRERPTTLPSEPRAAMVQAARDEFTKRGYFMSSIDAMADEAGVPIEAALRIFPTKAHVIVGALKSGHDTLAQGITDDFDLGRDTLAVLNQHFLRLARLVAAERPFMDALIAAVAHDTYAEPEGLLSIKRELNFPDLMATVIERGQRDGSFIDDQPAAELAALLTNTLLLRCFTRREVSAEENAMFVARLVLDGVRKT